MRTTVLTLLLLVSPGPASADGSELALPPREAFAIGARTTVRDVDSLDPAQFNRDLRAAEARGEEWTDSFIQIALRFVRPPSQGQVQAIEVATSPYGWEGIAMLEWARVTIEDRKYPDDSVYGERWVVWIVPARSGEGLEVARGLRAWECFRTLEAWFYSAQPCP